MALKHLASINNKQGFTIVELLIVIVVIGILAAITIVSYTGIAASAYGAKASMAADAYVKLLKMYKVEHGNYPISVSGPVCLGSIDNYQAEGVFEAGQCVVVDNGDGTFFAIASVNGDINNSLMEHTRQLPNGSLPNVVLDGVSHRGLFYMAVGGDGSLGVGYALSGNQDCPSGEQFYDEETNFSGCTITLD